MKGGKENLFRVVGRSVDVVFSGEGIGGTHGGAGGVIPF